MDPSVFWMCTLFVISVFSTSNAAEVCSTPQGKFGPCEHLRKCTSLVQLLLQAGSLPSVKDYLANSICGGDARDPKVCCPTHIEIPWIGMPDEDTEEKPATNGYLVHPYLPRNCGRGSPNTKHYHGNSGHASFAAIDDFPWLALLEYDEIAGNQTASLCTGSLISDRYVLTAAHCIKAIKGEYELVRVRLGEFDRFNDRDCAVNSKGIYVCADKPVVVGISDIIIHEDYGMDKNGLKNDIALLRLFQNVNFTDFIQPICLPFHNFLQQELISTGWGLLFNILGGFISKGSKYRNVLPVVGSEVCSKTFIDSFESVMESDICVGLDKNKQACRRDEGGPLMAFEGDENNDGRWICKGIFAFGSLNCGLNSEKQTGMYTNVFEHVPWITKQLHP